MRKAFKPLILLLWSVLLLEYSQAKEQQSLKQTSSTTISQSKALVPPKDAAHVFVLHRFDDKKHASTSVSTQELKKLFDYLIKKKYHIAKLSEVIEKLKNKEALPNNWVLFSIDDSYKSFYQHGYPLFKKYNFPFVLYVYIEATQRHFGDFMSWKQIKEVAKLGELGLHSFGHKHMTFMNSSQMHQDTAKALAIFKKELGYKPKSYAYPFGEFDQTLKNVIMSYDFDLIFNQNNGAISHKSSIYDLDRIALMGKIAIKPKLDIKYLPAIWNKVQIDVKKRILKHIDISVDPQYKSVQCYVSGHTWHTFKLKNGKITHNFDLKLKKGRSRIIIKTPDNRWSSKIIIL